MHLPGVRAEMSAQPRQEDTRKPPPWVDTLTGQQITIKTVLRWLVRRLFRATMLCVILGMLPALILVWLAPPTITFILFRVALTCALVTILPVLILGWVNPPTTAFMLHTRASLADAGDEQATIQYRWVDFDDISPAMRLAAVAAEDPKFLRHNGFDWRAILNTLNQNRAGYPMAGASTISQQVARNLFLWPGRTYFRKALEAYVTLLIEGIWSKRRILELYLNISQFDSQVFGVGAAAAHFFGTLAAELTDKEAALLAAVLSNPLLYHVEAPSDWVRNRQATILQFMEWFGPDYLGRIR